MEFKFTGVVQGALRVWKLAEGASRVGRDAEAGISILDRSVSRNHAVVRRDGSVVMLDDTNSRNGTSVNGERLAGPHRLRNDDRVAFGNVVLRFSGRDPAAQPSFTHHGDVTSTLKLHWDQIRDSAPPEGRQPVSVLQALSEMGDFLARRQAEEELFDLSLEWVDRLVRFQRACLLLVSDSGQAELRASRVKTGKALDRLVLSQTIVQTVLRERTAILVKDAMSDERFIESKSVTTGQIRSALVAPLFDNANVIGVLYVDTSESGAYAEDDLRRLALLANILAVKISNARLVEAERETERMRQEMETAARIQRALLPRKLTPPDGYEMEARLVPSTEAGGDLYDVLPLSGGRTLIAVGDVAGHGVGAALVMANVMAAMRAMADTAADPADLVSRLHTQMWGTAGGVSYITLFVGILEDHRLRFCNAGHEFPALIQAGAATVRLVSTGPPVNLIPDPQFESKTVDLPEGALLGIWTDGISEAHAVTDSGTLPAFFGDAGSVEERLESAQHRPLAEIAQEIFSAIDRFLEGHTAPDDATLFLLRRL